MITSQQLARYHELYSNFDVTFTKEVIGLLGLQTKFVFLKTNDGQWPCVINSSSLIGAKVIAGTKTGLLAKIQQGPSALSLRFSFVDSENKDPVSFFINSKLLGFSPYGSPESDLVLLQLQYSQRAPDFLIEKLGFFLDTHVNATRRGDERILVAPDSMRIMGIMRKETLVYMHGVPRHCILRDISFSGAKIIMSGLLQFMDAKEITLRIDFEDPREVIELRGRIVRTEEVQGRKDFVAVAINFFDEEIPMAYKMRLNSYIRTQTKQNVGSPEQRNFDA